MVVDGLADALCDALHLDLLFIRATLPGAGRAVEAMRPAAGPVDGPLTADLRAWIDAPPPTGRLTVLAPGSREPVAIAQAAIDAQDVAGGIVAGARRPGFPTEADRRLLRFAAEQATAGLAQAAAIEALRRRERDLGDFVEQAVVPIHWVGSDGRILWANQAELDLLGYAADEYIGHHIAEFHADSETIAEILAQLQNRHSLRDHEARLRHKDGSIRHVLISSNVRWENNRFVHTRCFTRDVTDRRLADRRLAVQHAVAQCLAESMTIEAVGGKLLPILGESFDWTSGALWIVDRSAEALRRIDAWPRPDLPDAPPPARPGEGLAGQVWAAGRPVYLADRSDGAGGPRPAAGAPIRVGDEIRGVIELASDAGQPDADCLDLLAAAGHQIGQFLERQRAESELIERTRQAELAAEIGRALTSDRSLREQLQHCVEAIVPHLDAAFARIWTLNSDENVLELQASAGMYTHLDGVHGRIPVGSYKVGRIAAEQRPHLTNQVLGDPGIADQEWARREGLIAFAGYPLLIRDRTIGVLALFARHPLTESTLRTLESIADEIAVGIARATADESRTRLLIHLREARDDLETVNRVGQILTSELNLQEIVQAVTDAATALAGAEFGAFFYNVTDEEGESYLLYTLSGAPAEAFAGFPMPRATPLFEPTFRGRGIVRLDDVRGDPRYGGLPPHHGMPAGHLPVVSYLAVPVISRTGEVLGGLFFGHSRAGIFTAREERIVAGLAAQAAIAMDNAQLFQRVQVALRIRDEFLSAVAHDLKTPLAVLKLNAQLLQRQIARAGALDPARVQLGLAGVDGSVTRLTRLVDQLLDIALLNSGQKPELDRRPTDLVALAQRLAAEHQEANHRHEIVVEAAVPELTGWWDASRLERVIDNLLNNALKYSPEGGRVTIALDQPKDAAGAWATIAIRDPGIGIPADDLPHIFERFRRGSNVGRRIGGTGIGLFSARQIVEWHRGRIEVASREGAGSTFTVRLPIAGDAAGT